MGKRFLAVAFGSNSGGLRYRNFGSGAPRLLCIRYGRRGFDREWYDFGGYDSGRSARDLGESDHKFSHLSPGRYGKRLFMAASDGGRSLLLFRHL